MPIAICTHSLLCLNINCLAGITFSSHNHKHAVCPSAPIRHCCHLRMERDFHLLSALATGWNVFTPLQLLPFSPNNIPMNICHNTWHFSSIFLKPILFLPQPPPLLPDRRRPSPNLGHCNSLLPAPPVLPPATHPFAIGACFIMLWLNCFSFLLTSNLIVFCLQDKFRIA